MAKQGITLTGVNILMALQHFVCDKKKKMTLLDFWRRPADKLIHNIDYLNEIIKEERIA